MRWKKSLCTSLVAVSLTLVPVIPLWAATPSQTNLDTLTQVYTWLVNEHYTHPSEDDLLQAAIQGMLNQINDPFTSYLTPDEYKQFTDYLNQSFAGIGISMAASDDGKTVLITEVNAGGPAEQAGLQQGDRIVQVDEQPVAGSSLQDVADKIQGDAGTTVTLKIQHADGSLQIFTIKRAAIELPEVISHDLGNDIGYLRIMTFGERTTEQFQTQLSDLQSHGAKGLVLDLRGNGGGLVQSALEIADSLLRHGTILITHDEQGQPQAIVADGKGSDIPLVVLVDRNSASASEILAGALQKNGRAKLVGERTFGKGTMQVPHELPNGGYLKVSIDKWDTADGTSPDHVGLTPDIHVTEPDAVLNAAMQQLLPDRLQELKLPRQSSGYGTLNGVALYDVPQLQEQDNQIYLPLRYTVESLGAEVDWLGTEQAIRFQLDGHQVSLDIAHGALLIDDQASTVPHPLRFYGSTAYLSTAALQAIIGQPIEVGAETVTIHSH